MTRSGRSPGQRPPGEVRSQVKRSDLLWYLLYMNLHPVFVLESQTYQSSRKKTVLFMTIIAGGMAIAELACR